MPRTLIPNAPNRNLAHAHADVADALAHLIAARKSSGQDLLPLYENSVATQRTLSASYLQDANALGEPE